MTRSEKFLGIFGATAFMAAAVFSVSAQDGGEAAPAAEGGGDKAEAPAVPVKARPAEIMPLTAKGLLLDVVHTGEQYVAVGDRGGIIVSADGKDWTQKPVPVRAALTAVTFADAKHGWAVGHDAAIVGTADGGHTWTLQNFKPELEKPLLDVLFLDAQHGFAVGAYGLFLKTEDAGSTWGEVDAPAVRADEVHLNSITRLGDGSLFIAGESGMLAVSPDQGKTWSKVNTPYESSLFGALPVGDKGAIMYGLRGNIFVTQDVRSGKWTKVETGNVSSMFGGTRLPDGRLVMVGLNGVIWTTDANGGGVRRVPTTVGTTQSAVVAFKSGLLMVGESGVQVVSKLQ